MFLHQTAKSFRIQVGGHRSNLTGELFALNKAKLIALCKKLAVRCTSSWPKEVVLHNLLRYLLPKADPWTLIGPGLVSTPQRDLQSQANFTDELEVPELQAVELMDTEDDPDDESLQGEDDMDVDD